MGIDVYYPRPELRPYVRYYYVLTSDVPVSTLTFPHGCPQIIFHKRSPLFIPELAAPQARFAISGQVNFPAHVVSDGNTEMIVIVFRPHTIGWFIDTPPSAFYNAEISGYDLANRRLNELASRVFDGVDSLRCVELIEQWLLAGLQRFPLLADVQRVGEAVNRLMATPSASVKALAEKACLGPKQFGRLFNAHVGMMPKEYARIVRFQKAMKWLQHQPRNYADMASVCGYSDQSHLIREFRLFSGTTPAALLRPYSDLFTSPA